MEWERNKEGEFSDVTTVERWNYFRLGLEGPDLFSPFLFPPAFLLPDLSSLSFPHRLALLTDGAW